MAHIVASSAGPTLTVIAQIVVGQMTTPAATATKDLPTNNHQEG